MSKEVQWGLIHGEGNIECECDQCGRDYSYPFEDGDIDFKSCQDELRSQGWSSKKINGEWYDFCCEECYKKFMEKTKKNEQF